MESGNPGKLKEYRQDNATKAINRDQCCKMHDQVEDKQYAKKGLHCNASGCTPCTKCSHVETAKQLQEPMEQDPNSQPQSETSRYAPT